jgi:hypothetical protein
MRSGALVVMLLVVVAAGRSDVTATPAAQRQAPGSVDCVPYDAATLRLRQEAGDTWMLERADGARFRRFANRADAEAGLAVFREHSALCSIGRGNTFPKPYHSEYVMEFLKR